MPAARERPPRRARHHLPGRAGPGQDPHDPLAHRPARRVDADRRRQRDQRRPVRPGLPPRPRPRRTSRATTRPIDWVHRDDRFGEKLATPDTSIADLIGEVDPIKVAEGRYLSDELTLHYGLVPRTNRGIFAINELPDLAERIQVGLLNVLEERDVQVRGYKIRLPLDVMLVASANPEDYTNRGRIITPLKDRFGSQIRTHYPLEVATEVAIMRQEARPAVGRRRARHACPTTWRRSSPRSPTWPASRATSTSARVCRCASRVSNSEVLAANAVRRALRTGERDGRAPGLRPRRAGRVDVGQDRDRDARRGPRGPDRREHAQGGGAHRVQGAALARAASATSSPPSRRASSPTPARTSRRRRRPSCCRRSPGAARARGRADRGDESPGRRGQRRRVRARGPAPVEAAQQGRRPAPAPPTAAGADRRRAPAPPSLRQQRVGEDGCRRVDAVVGRPPGSRRRPARPPRPRASASSVPSTLPSRRRPARSADAPGPRRPGARAARPVWSMDGRARRRSRCRRAGRSCPARSSSSSAGGRRLARAQRAGAHVVVPRARRASAVATGELAVQDAPGVAPGHHAGARRPA